MGQKPKFDHQPQKDRNFYRGPRKKFYKDFHNNQRMDDKDRKIRKDNRSASATLTNENVLWLDGKVQGQKVKCLVDTGAVHSFLSEELIRKLKLKIVNIAPITVVSGNSAPLKLSKEVETPIELPGLRKIPFNFKWKTTAELCDDVILGADFLKRFKLVVDLGHKRVHIRESTETPEEIITSKVDLHIEEIPIREENSAIELKDNVFWTGKINNLVSKRKENQKELGSMKNA